MSINLRDQLRVDVAGEHHADDGDRLGTGHAVAALELARDVEALQHPGDLRAAAVDDDRLDADIAEVRNVFGDRALQLFGDHRVAAVLDDDDLVAKTLEPGQRLDQDGCLLGCLIGGGLL